ncbi:Uncharacterized protein HZ326_4182 [Fusarium oxysporum f. sp. albedinis]|nr:Uncharacterized protein HZ326_4182 [Fusarium oxysporum f. sp. albedinis]
MQIVFVVGGALYGGSLCGRSQFSGGMTNLAKKSGKHTECVNVEEHVEMPRATLKNLPGHRLASFDEPMPRRC